VLHDFQAAEVETKSLPHVTAHRTQLSPGDVSPWSFSLLDRDRARLGHGDMARKA
jgi:hypothetical protein